MSELRVDTADRTFNVISSENQISIVTQLIGKGLYEQTPELELLLRAGIPEVKAWEIAY